MDRIDGFAGDSPDAAKRRLTRRLVMAGVLIVILLGALAVFDQLSRMEAEDTAPARPIAKAPEPAPVGPSVRTDGSYPVGAPPPPPIQPSIADEPKVEPPPKPEVAAQPVAEPAAPAPAPAAKPAPKPVAKPVVPVPDAVPEGTVGGELRPAGPTPAVAPAPGRPVLPQLKRGYVLQAGVFTSTERAEELRARLVMAGVPVTVESRVQVGPFATAREAAAAREKIKALGVDSIVIPPTRSRPSGR